jgi:hypothetical protein
VTRHSTRPVPTLLTRRLARARRLAGRVWLIIGERAAAPRVRQQRSELLRLLLQPARRARLRVTPLVSLTAHPSADVERAGLPGCQPLFTLPETVPNSPQWAAAGAGRGAAR